MAASQADLAILIRATDASSSVFASIGKNAQAAMGGLAAAAAAPQKAFGTMMDVLGKVGLAAGGIHALVDAGRGLSETLGVGLNSEMEQVRASINAFTKDGAQTEEILKKIRTEANLTPFGFREMATATAALMPVAKGAKVDLMALVKEAEVLAASNPLQGLEGASFSLREAMTGDFTSIIERFNLSRTTINKLKEQGVPNLEIVRKAMAEMGFDQDLIAGKAQTLEGRWSTFMDTIDTLRMKIGEPIFDVLKDSLVGLQSIFDANTDAIGAFADGIAANIGRTITIVKALWAAFTVDKGAIGIVKEQLAGIFGPEFAEQIDGFLAAFMNAIPAIQEFAGQVVSGLGQVVDFVKSNLQPILAGLGAVLLAAFGPGIIAGIGAFVGALLTVVPPIAAAAAVGVLLYEAWVNNLGGIQEKVAEFVPLVVGAFQLLAGGIQALINGDVAGALEFFQQLLTDAIPTIAQTLAAWGVEFINWIAPMIPPALEALGAFALQVGSWIAEQAPGWAQQLLLWAQEFIAWIAPMIPPALEVLGAFALQVVGWIAEQAPIWGQQLLAWGQEFVAWVGPMIPPALQALAGFGGAVFAWIAEQAPILTQNLVAWAVILAGNAAGSVSSGQAGGWVLSAAAEVIPALGEFLLAITGWIIGTAYPELLKFSLNMGLAILKGIVQGVVGLAGQLGAAIAHELQKIRIDVGPFHISASGVRIDLPGDNDFKSGGGGTSYYSGDDGYPGGLFRAAGGPVSAGRGYIVGERGPEWFVPGESGRIVPNGSGSPAVQIHVHGSLVGQQDLERAIADYWTRAARSGRLALA